MADERSRSPLPGAESLAKPADPDRQIHTQLEDIQRLLHQHTGRLNTLDQRSAHTKDQLQKQQQLVASKQAIISSWPDSSTRHDRQKAVERLVEKEGLRNMYVCTQTLKAKGGSGVLHEGRPKRIPGHGQKGYAHLPWPDSSRQSPNSKVPTRGRSTLPLRHRSLRSVSWQTRAL